jgi:hypothetical protein
MLAVVVIRPANSASAKAHKWWATTSGLGLWYLAASSTMYVHDNNDKHKGSNGCGLFGKHFRLLFFKVQTQDKVREWHKHDGKQRGFNGMGYNHCLLVLGQLAVGLTFHEKTMDRGIAACHMPQPIPQSSYRKSSNW